MSDIIKAFKEAHYDPEIGFAYNPKTGDLWRVHHVETTAERANDGRLCARKLSCLGNIAKVVTHIMWRIMTGDWPRQGMLIDHRDGVVHNMTWSNLREATHSQNAANKLSPGRYNNTHIHMEIGVVKEHNRFAVSIGKKYYGRFDTVEEANSAAIAKRKELFGEFVREEKPSWRRI